MRSILDQYANQGRGVGAAEREVSPEEARAAHHAANLSRSDLKMRNSTNQANRTAALANKDYTITDVLALLTADKKIARLEHARNHRLPEGDPARQNQKAVIAANFVKLTGVAIKMLADNVQESDEIRLFGMKVKLVKGQDGMISAVAGEGAGQVKFNLGKNAEDFLSRLLGRAVVDADALGAAAVKEVLNKVYDKDLEGMLTAADRISLTRHFASLIIVSKSQDTQLSTFHPLVKGNYNTGLLVEIAEKALEGEVTTKAQLDELHEKIKRDNAGLDDTMKAMLMDVAGMPIVKSDKPYTDFVVQSPLVGDVNQIAQQVVGPANGAPQQLRAASAADVKDFVADLVFSDETMVADVLVNKPGEAMRKFLIEPKNLGALAAILKNPNELDGAAAPDIVNVLKEGFAKLAELLDEPFRAANNGETLAQAAAKPDFANRLAAFLGSAERLPGAVLAKFDAVVQSMANKGCENIQTFMNQVFQIDQANANEIGSLLNEPYKNKSAAEIKDELKGKSLNQILDGAANADTPGQVGFFKQVLSTYFVNLAKADKRSCFAASLRYASTFEFGDKQGDELESARNAAVNKFAGAVLKGTSPLLQKMMQGLPKEIMGGFADALADMKSNLAPMPRKVVQAHLMKMIKESNGKIASIAVNESLGAASVGEAFLCTFKVKAKKPKMIQNPNPKNGADAVIVAKDENGNTIMEDCWDDQQYVVKLMRHDAETRVKREAEIFTAAAKKIGPGMEKTWEGQLKQYMTEFDFTREAANTKVGEELYDIANGKNTGLHALAPKVASMKIAKIVPPTKNALVAERVFGTTVDSFFKKSVNEIRGAVSAVFEQDPETKRIKWQDGPMDPETGKPTQVPVFKQNLVATAPFNARHWIATNYNLLQAAQDKIIQATKAWFHEALLGSGKFHGDAHSGNLMVRVSDIAFIDFGNLYQLATRDKLDANGNVVMGANGQPEKVDERVELLRVIMGATTRDKKFFLQGFENLLSPEGKRALAANRAKAEAILEAVLPMGKFSYDVAYRLQAAVVELQKLGLELPSQINCFILSMVRLQNTVSEMNTIMNQCKAMKNAIDTMRVPPRAEPRDELDLLGKMFDLAASPEGQQEVENEDDIFYDDRETITHYQQVLFSEELGGLSPQMSPVFKKNGSYYNQVVTRLNTVADPVAEATRLVAMLFGHTDPEHNEADADALHHNLDPSLETFRNAFAAAKTPEEKTAAIETFALAFSTGTRQLLGSIKGNEMMVGATKIKPPASFASAIMGVLFASSDAVEEMVNANFTKAEKLSLMSSITGIATSELNVGKAAMAKSVANSLLPSFLQAQDVPSPDELVTDAIVEDSKQMGGDDSYQVDVGV
ncbi:MAG: hypothetical protein IKO40_09380 [Kiritimatiellae bacterium]|nr:hypothetical protein [Kiritimatiellia bacterium]